MKFKADIKSKLFTEMFLHDVAVLPSPCLRKLLTQQIRFNSVVGGSCWHIIGSERDKVESRADWISDGTAGGTHSCRNERT